MAWHSANEQVPAAVISASHNPYRDNGIKLFAAGGLKLPDDVEERLEAELGADLAPSAEIGLVRRRIRADEPYIEFLAGTLEGRGLDGLSVVLDCANGAASHVAPEVFEAVGCDVEVIAATHACKPDRMRKSPCPGSGCHRRRESHQSTTPRGVPTRTSLRSIVDCAWPRCTCLGGAGP